MSKQKDVLSNRAYFWRNTFKSLVIQLSIMQLCFQSKTYQNCYHLAFKMMIFLLATKLSLNFSKELRENCKNCYKDEKSQMRNHFWFVKSLSVTHTIN